MGNVVARLLGQLLHYPGSLLSFLARSLRSQLSNEYLVGMVLMAGVTPLTAAAARVAAELKSALLQLVFTNVRLGEQETKELMEYLRQHPSVPNGSMLTMCTHSDIESDVSGSRVYEYEPELNTAIRFYHRSAKTGTGHWIWVANYTYSESTAQPDPVVSTTVTVFGRDKGPVEEMIDAGREMLRTKRRKFLQVITTYNYTQDNYGLGWNHGYKTDKQQPGRSIKSVILPQIQTLAGVAGGGAGSVGGGGIGGGGGGGSGHVHAASDPLDQAEALLADAREFLESERWYTERGIPYRRGYLLYGIPGGGKSSLVAAVASELKLPIYMLQLSNELLTDDSLHKLFQTMTLNPSILLLEDIDAASDLVKTREGTVDAAIMSKVETEGSAGVISGAEESNSGGAGAVGSFSSSDDDRENSGEDSGGGISEDGSEGDAQTFPLASASELHQDGYAAQIEDDFSPTKKANQSGRSGREAGSGVDRGVSSSNGASDGEKNGGGGEAQLMMLQLMKQQQEDQKKEREEKKKRDRKITLSGLLNALDGPTATTGRILFMTTNFRNKLDPALIRSGRIDYEIEFRYVDAWQAERLFKRFYLSFRDDEDVRSSGGGGGSSSSGPKVMVETEADSIGETVHDVKDSREPQLAAPSLSRSLSGTASAPGPTKEETRKLAKVFAGKVSSSGLPLSAADLQGHLMKYKSDPRTAVQNMEAQLLAPMRVRVASGKAGASPSRRKNNNNNANSSFAQPPPPRD